MPVRPPSGLIASEPLTYDDPLTFMPDEPRYTVMPLIPSMEQLLSHELVTASDSNFACHVVGQSSGTIFVFRGSVLILKLSHDADSSDVSSLHIAHSDSQLLVFYSGSSRGSISVHYVDLQRFDSFSKQLVQSSSEDQITAIASFNDQICFGTQRGRVYLVGVPPNKSFIVKLFETQAVNPINKIIFLRFYLVFVNKTDLYVFDSNTQKQFLKQNCKNGTVSTDGDLLLIGSGEQVQILLFRFKEQKYDTPLSMGVLTALGYIDTQQVSANLNETCYDLINFCTFGEEQEWDGIIDQQNINTEGLYKPQNQSKEKDNIQVEEIANFVVQDPPVHIVGIQACGESIVIIGISEAANVTNRISTEYSYGEAEMQQQIIHMMSYDIFGEPLHGAIIPVTGPVLEFKPASSTLLALPSYILTTKSQSFLLKPATVDNHLKYLLEQNKYQTALRAAMVLKGFMGEEWSKMLPFCENQVVEYDNQLENLYEGVLQPLAVQQKYYAYVQPHTYQIGVDLERRYKMVKREDRKQSSKDNDTMTVIPEYITKQQLIPKKINIKTLLQSIVTTFLLQNQPGEAAGLLQNFLVADDQLWTQLSLQFGLSQNFRDLLPLLPIPEEHSRLPIISLTLATNFDSFVQLILKWKQDAFPQALMNILLPITQFLIVVQIFLQLDLFYHICRRTTYNVSNTQLVVIKIM
ncbi:7fold_repeat in clathrin and VPS proteins repeat-containing protein [Hexamita inflata]|uniref:7fold repeat in clathrin and VPS proteins repeat-containing protein n=1 Tax=Hexamita inflata TaxID=28002 RepID=A0AA86PU00_9EUKA|nr:7fold repeat in clathrin and VPS proteins repeat-containing protein [Hexamita inflata]